MVTLYDYTRMRVTWCCFGAALVVACGWMSEGGGDATELLGGMGGGMRGSKISIAADCDGSTVGRTQECAIQQHIPR